MLYCSAYSVLTRRSYFLTVKFSFCFGGIQQFHNLDKWSYVIIAKAIESVGGIGTRIQFSVFFGPQESPCQAGCRIS